MASSHSGGLGGSSASSGVEAMGIQVDLSKYLSAAQLASMSALEQLSIANRIKNYEVLRQLGNILFLM